MTIFIFINVQTINIERKWSLIMKIFFQQMIKYSAKKINILEFTLKLNFNIYIC